MPADADLPDDVGVASKRSVDRRARRGVCRGRSTNTRVGSGDPLVVKRALRDRARCVTRTTSGSTVRRMSRIVRDPVRDARVVGAAASLGAAALTAARRASRAGAAAARRRAGGRVAAAAPARRGFGASAVPARASPGPASASVLVGYSAASRCSSRTRRVAVALVAEAREASSDSVAGLPQRVVAVAARGIASRRSARRRATTRATSLRTTSAGRPDRRAPCATACSRACASRVHALAPSAAPPPDARRSQSATARRERDESAHEYASAHRSCASTSSK